MVPIVVISILVTLTSGILGFVYLSGGAAILAQTIFVAALLTACVTALGEAIEYRGHHRPV